MAKGYIVFTEQVNDAEAMAQYGSKAVATIMASSGMPLVAGPPEAVLEGDWHGTQTIILEFPSVEEAKAWYGSAEYQAVIGERFAAADSNAAVFAGFDLGG